MIATADFPTTDYSTNNRVYDSGGTIIDPATLNSENYFEVVDQPEAFIYENFNRQFERKKRALFEELYKKIRSDKAPEIFQKYGEDVLMVGQAYLELLGYLLPPRYSIELSKDDSIFISFLYPQSLSLYFELFFEELENRLYPVELNIVVYQNKESVAAFTGEPGRTLIHFFKNYWLKNFSLAFE